MTLGQVPTGQSAEITHVELDGAFVLRLMEMGLVPGARVTVQKRAPFGGPMEIEVFGYRLSIRGAEADRLKVRVSDAL